MSNNFQAWIDQADMPEQVNGQWIDLETGVAYDPTHNYNTKAVRQSISPKAQDARNIAKAFGGKALTGSVKQKEWAEKIRAEKLAGMTQDQAEMACDPKGLLTAAKFWIENRGAFSSEIGEFVMQQKALLAQARNLKAAGQAAEYAAAAEKYNSLTARWGF